MPKGTNNTAIEELANKGKYRQLAKIILEVEIEYHEERIDILRNKLNLLYEV